MPMVQPNPHQTATLLALLLSRSEQSRARVSARTVRKLAVRRKLRSKFVSDVKDELEMFGVTMSELERGSFGLLRMSVLEGAPCLTAAKYLPDILPKLRQGNLRFDSIRKELGADFDSDLFDEDE